MTLTLARPAPTAEGPVIPAGETVRYVGHLPGGMIRVQWGPGRWVIHPDATAELRTKETKR